MANESPIEVDAMFPIPELVGISDLRLRQNEILNKLSDGPVVLTQRSKAVAVIVSPEQWNQLVGELEDLRDILAAREARADAEPAWDLDEYIAQRPQRVSHKAE
jgi:prevent-host-death family protein